MTNEVYYLVIQCQAPHSKYNRRIPFNWYPSGTEMFDSIRRLRDQAKRDGVTDVVKIKHVVLQHLSTVESKCVDLSAVNLSAQTSVETKVL